MDWMLSTSIIAMTQVHFSYKLIAEILKEEIKAVSGDYKSLLRTEIRDLNG